MLPFEDARMSGSDITLVSIEQWQRHRELQNGAGVIAAFDTPGPGGKGEIRDRFCPLQVQHCLASHHLLCPTRDIRIGIEIATDLPRCRNMVGRSEFAFGDAEVGVPRPPIVC
jgi:hypothetical protein